MRIPWSGILLTITACSAGFWIGKQRLELGARQAQSEGLLQDLNRCQAQRQLDQDHYERRLEGIRYVLFETHQTDTLEDAKAVCEKGPHAEPQWLGTTLEGYSWFNDAGGRYYVLCRWTKAD